MSLFEDKNYLNRKMPFGKNLSFEEILIDSKDEPQVFEDERETLDNRILTLLVILPLAILGLRLLFLQSVHGQEYKALAEGNKLRATPTYAPRGLIMDNFGKTIASNLPNFELDIVPADLPDDQASVEMTVTKISEILNIPKTALDDKVNALDRKSVLTQNILPSITKEQALVLLSKQSEYPGFVVNDNPIRDYKDSQIFSPVVGYSGKITQDELAARANQGYLFNDFVGKTGLEIEYEDYLRGVSGQKQTEIDASGNSKKTLAELQALPGNNIRLNIDYDLQKTIYDSLVRSIAKYRLPNRAAAVATNPKTGEVLGLVSIPSYDNNQFARGITQDEYSALLNDSNHPLINRVISGLYPPGSTVKPMMAIAGLSENVVTPQTKILDDGVIRVGSFTFYGYRHEGLGVMDVYTAIAKSSDIYFYTVGGGRAGTSISGLGPEKIAEWLRKFHLGSQLGIDLPGEKSGLVPDSAWKRQARNEQWFLGDTYHYAIGQGDLLVTPLQVNSWTSTIANGGTVYQPHILKEVADHDGHVVKKIDPKVLAKDQFNQDYIKIVQDGMRQTVTLGSAQSLKTVGMPVAGKTGSAQFDPKEPSRTHAWFTSYAPADDPQIALTILMEGAGEGSSYAVPVTHEVYDWYVTNRLHK
ncbi:MAG: penicillin-binding protein 2 [Candidatus Doudnabacteria bacterium]|nr:penicillin-binding protein 2 [Candidatus Doudnabacteria bacterium]